MDDIIIPFDYEYVERRVSPVTRVLRFILAAFLFLMCLILFVAVFTIAVVLVWLRFWPQIDLFLRQAGI